MLIATVLSPPTGDVGPACISATATHTLREDAMGIISDRHDAAAVRHSHRASRATCPARPADVDTDVDNRVRAAISAISARAADTATTANALRQNAVRGRAQRFKMTAIDHDHIASVAAHGPVPAQNHGHADFAVAIRARRRSAFTTRPATAAHALREDRVSGIADRRDRALAVDNHHTSIATARARSAETDADVDGQTRVAAGIAALQRSRPAGPAATAHALGENADRVRAACGYDTGVRDGHIAAVARSPAAATQAKPNVHAPGSLVLVGLRSTGIGLR